MAGESQDVTKNQIFKHFSPDLLEEKFLHEICHATERNSFRAMEPKAPRNVIRAKWLKRPNLRVGGLLGKVNDLWLFCLFQKAF